MNSSLLMCTPEYFGVQYVINPWMQNQMGQVDPDRAHHQWKSFYQLIQKVANVELLTPQPHVPDLVFTANAGLFYEKTFIPSLFRHEERKREEPFFKSWFRSRGYKIKELPGKLCFEGAGDALFQPGKPLLWAGYGFRTDQESHSHLEKILGIKVISLHLVHPKYYHLDTCFCPLARGQVMYYPGAFDVESVRKIEHEVPEDDRIVVSEEDAQHFTCNAVLIGDSVILNQASPQLKSQLENLGYGVNVQPVPEFLKAGGANKCLTLSLDYPLLMS